MDQTIKPRLYCVISRVWILIKKVFQNVFNSCAISTRSTQSPSSTAQTVNRETNGSTHPELTTHWQNIRRILLRMHSTTSIRACVNVSIDQCPVLGTSSYLFSQLLLFKTSQDNEEYCHASFSLLVMAIRDIFLLLPKLAMACNKWSSSVLTIQTWTFSIF